MRMYSFMPGQDKPDIPRLQRDDIGITGAPENSAGSWNSRIRWPTTVTQKEIAHGRQKSFSFMKANHAR